MFRKLNVIRTIYIVCIVISTVVFALADTIRLKDGSIIKGKIVNYDNGVFTLMIDDGTRQRTLKYSTADVESIIFDAQPMPANSMGKPTTPNDDKTTIITVGQTKPPVLDIPNNSNNSKKDPPTLIVSDRSSNSTNQNTPKTSVITSKPITIRIPVLADNTTNGWTNSGWVVRKGQKIKVFATGRVSLGNGRYSTPTGISTLPDADKLMKDRATGGLVAVIGADNNDFIYRFPRRRSLSWSQRGKFE
jgi:hypothetical protein